MNNADRAEANILALSQNPYPGRIIVLGRTTAGSLVQLYSIMGRSANSRNRVFGQGPNGRVFTEAANESKVEDPSLIIYDAMLETQEGGEFIVSNGKQTTTAYNMLRFSHNLAQAIVEESNEPDAPNYTPRITGLFATNPGQVLASLSIIRSGAHGEKSDRELYQYGDISPGFGYLVSTYDGDGDPLPSFSSKPLIVPIVGNTEAEIAEAFWGKLNEANRISIAAKVIGTVIGAKVQSAVHVINQYQKVT
jgi:IMP cyclohydrolase